MAFWLIGTDHLKGPTMTALNRRPPTGPTCECGHSKNGHSKHSTRPCLACIKCDTPGHDPHAAERCSCASYTPSQLTCPICGLLPGVGGDLCAECEPIVKTGGDPRPPATQQEGTNQ